MLINLKKTVRSMASMMTPEGGRGHPQGAPIRSREMEGAVGEFGGVAEGFEEGGE